MTFAQLATFTLAAFIVVIVPGPSVALIIANSLRAGPLAGLMNVAGTQAGLVPMILIVAFGLETVVAVMSDLFFWLKLVGAAYLIWLGIGLLQSNGKMSRRQGKNLSLRGYFWQGFVVIWSNPKALFFFGAFIPQFIDPAKGNAFWSTILLGGIFIALATVCDSLYAVISGKAGQLLTRSRVRLLEISSGIALITGGAWLAFAKRA